MLRIFIAAVLMAASAAADALPGIVKLGTIDCDLVEATPVVFRDKLYRFEYVRERYEPNTTGDSYFRFIDVEAGTATPALAQGYHLGSAFVDGGTVYAFGVPEWGGQEITAFWSKDLKEWESAVALDLPGWEIFNNSVCHDGGRYVMAFEIRQPAEQAGVPFTTRFAVSEDARNWELTPPEYVHTKERYSACPTLRHVDGWYYMTYLNAYPGYWATHIARSRDLQSWEESPLNPILEHSEADKKIADPGLSEGERQRTREAKNVNNSDLDFCTWRGETVLYYSWGNQHGVEHLAEARYPAPMAGFLRACFPEGEAVGP